MRMLALLATLPLTIASGPRGFVETLPIAVPNPNTVPAGELRDGVLRVTLDAKLSMWHPDGDSLPGMPIEAFAEPGRAPQAPGPLIRVPEGVEIHASVRNSLERDSLTFYFHAGDVVDSLVIPSGLTRELRVKPARAGTFLYRATTSTPLGRALRFAGLLSGAMVIDSAGVTGAPRDRVFVMTVAADSLIPNSGIPLPERSVWAINGRSWPHTERFSVTVGDTLRWRFVNAANDHHPMHLHGFYYRVDGFDGPAAAVQSQGLPGRRVVTERMTQFTAMSISWVPERAGNWLFHCHFQEHVVPHGPLGVVLPSGETQRIAPSTGHRGGAVHGNHALTGMGGLVLGIEARPRRGERIARPARGRRHLRLIAVQDSLFPDSLPSMRFVLEDPRAAGRRIEAGPGSSPPIYLTRGEPVSITIVNRMPEATAVHWHGIELESYFDGVPGFGGFGKRLAPIIAPRDSFEARFTPPRAGTFIYHSHVDEPRQHRAGLVGALIVRDSPRADSTEERIVLIKSPRAGRTTGVLEINGQVDPDTLVVSAGRRYLLRVIAIQRGTPNTAVSITARPDSQFPTVRDTMIVQWRPLAKDGADLPEAARALKLARQPMAMGETYDFELVPTLRGNLRLEVRSGTRLYARVPIRVE